MSFCGGRNTRACTITTITRCAVLPLALHAFRCRGTKEQRRCIAQLVFRQPVRETQSRARCVWDDWCDIRKRLRQCLRCAQHAADDLIVSAVELWPLQLWVEIEGVCWCACVRVCVRACVPRALCPMLQFASLETWQGCLGGSVRGPARSCARSHLERAGRQNVEPQGNDDQPHDANF